MKLHFILYALSSSIYICNTQKFGAGNPTSTSFLLFTGFYRMLLGSEVKAVKLARLCGVREAGKVFRLKSKQKLQISGIRVCVNKQ